MGLQAPPCCLAPSWAWGRGCHGKHLARQRLPPGLGQSPASSWIIIQRALLLSPESRTQRRPALSVRSCSRHEASRHTRNQSPVLGASRLYTWHYLGTPLLLALLWLSLSSRRQDRHGIRERNAWWAWDFISGKGNWHIKSWQHTSQAAQAAQPVNKHSPLSGPHMSRTISPAQIKSGRFL